jgi:glycosyltransferase involved in cell wall biosynthesis
MSASVDAKPTAALPLVILMAANSAWSVDIACGLARSGLRVTVAYPKPRDNSAASGEAKGLSLLRAAGIGAVALNRRASSLLYPMGLAWQLRLLRERLGRFQLLTLYGGFFALAAWLSGIRPYSLYWVGTDINGAGRLKSLLLLPAYRGARLNVANGTNLARRAQERFGAGSLLALYHGVDIGYWSPDDVATPGGVICARWFEPVYDNATIVRAFCSPDLAAAGLSLTFTAGGSTLPECRAIAEATGRPPGDRLVFMGGGVDAECLRDLFRSAEIYVSMSLSDGASTALLQAMSCGCFPVVSDIAANREWLEHGCDMELVAVGDAEALAKALVRVHADPARRERARPHNRKIVQEQASLHTNLDRLANLLADVDLPGRRKVTSVPTQPPHQNRIGGRHLSHTGSEGGKHD